MSYETYKEKSGVLLKIEELEKLKTDIDKNLRDEENHRIEHHISSMNSGEEGNVSSFYINISIPLNMNGMDKVWFVLRYFERKEKPLELITECLTDSYRPTLQPFSKEQYKEYKVAILYLYQKIKHVYETWIKESPFLRLQQLCNGNFEIQENDEIKNLGWV